MPESAYMEILPFKNEWKANILIIIIPVFREGTGYITTGAICRLWAFKNIESTSIKKRGKSPTYYFFNNGLVDIPLPALYA